MMAETIDRAGLQVAATLARFLEQDALPGTGIEPDVFWRGVADIYAASRPTTGRCWRRATRCRRRIDAWHDAHPGPPPGDAYRAFLRDIGYLADEPAPFTIGPDRWTTRSRASPARNGRAGAQRALRAERRQCALGQPLRRAVRHRRHRRSSRGQSYDPARGARSSPGPKPSSTMAARSLPGPGPSSRAAIRCSPIPPSWSAGAVTMLLRHPRPAHRARSSTAITRSARRSGGIADIVLGRRCHDRRPRVRSPRSTRGQGRGLRQLARADAGATNAASFDKAAVP